MTPCPCQCHTVHGTPQARECCWQAHVSALEERNAWLIEVLDLIREATFAEFQLEYEGAGPFNPKRHVCPVCRRASTAEHLKRNWAFIQAAAAGVLRDSI